MIVLNSNGRKARLCRKESAVKVASRLKLPIFASTFILAAIKWHGMTTAASHPSIGSANSI